MIFGGMQYHGLDEDRWL